MSAWDSASCSGVTYRKAFSLKIVQNPNLRAFLPRLTSAAIDDSREFVPDFCASPVLKPNQYGAGTIASSG